MEVILRKTTCFGRYGLQNAVESVGSAALAKDDLMALQPMLIPILLWAVLLFGGFVFGKLWTDRTRRMPVWTRMASSLTLVAAAWWIYTLESTATVYTLPAALGMTFGFLGDLFMARLIRFSQHVLGGIGSFGIGHIFYVIGFLGTANLLGLTLSPIPVVIWWVIGAVGWWIAVWRGVTERTPMHMAALPYALLLSSTAGFATSMAVADARFIPLAVGAALFLLSDLLLAARLFRNVFFPLVDDVVWLTYGPAQMLIVFSSLSVLSALQ